MTLRLRLALATPVVLTALFVQAPVSSANSASKLYQCPVGSGKGYGYTHLTSLAIKYGEGISCSYAGGVATKGSSLQRSFKCMGKRLDTRAHYYNEQMTCTYAKYKLWVRFTYRQNRH